MSGAFVVILAAIILIVLFIPMFSQQLKHVRGVNKAQIRQHWQRIEGYLGQGESGIQRAITDADKLVDYVLRKSGTRGDNMGERLKASAHQFSNLNGLWTAHKLRNRVVHENDFKVGEPRARRALGEFRKALKDLGAL